MSPRSQAREALETLFSSTSSSPSSMVVRNRILKDVNGDINDHIRNHMHKHSPILHDRSLMRDLIVVQRSRSLKDPSASPPPLHSPVIADLLSKDGERFKSGRQLTGEHDGGSLSWCSPPLESVKVGGADYQATLGSECSSKSGALYGKQGFKMRCSWLLIHQ